MLSCSISFINPLHRQAVTSPPPILTFAEGGTSVCRHVMNMPLPRPDGGGITIVLYFEHRCVWEGVITRCGQVYSSSLSVHYSLHYPHSATLSFPSLSFILSHPFFSSTPSSLLDRGMAEIIIMFWHMALAPRTRRILTQSGSCQCDSPYCS